jgi:TolB-like protein/Flp pilus assembly protein TadD
MAEEQAPASQPTSGRDVFISYASHDRAVADSVCTALESAGIVCWIAPRDVVPGESFAGAIVHAIDATKVTVLVLSEHAVTSQHVLREIERASSKRHPVIAFRIDLAPMPADLEYFLNTSQWLDASTAGVKRTLPKLIDAARSALALPSSAVQNKVTPTAAASVTRRPTRMLFALAAIIVAALGYVLADKVWLSKRVEARRSPIAATPAISDNSVAVLPFTDMSEKKDQEYFADGMAEEIIDLLAKVPNLRVPARTSSFSFKGKQTTIPNIARELAVAHILEGSIRRSGNHLRVTAQLIRTDNGYHLWSQSYDRDLHDVFKVQDDIANAVVQALQITLLGGSVSRRAGGTQDLEAYQLFLRANSASERNNKASEEEARGYCERAIKLDPDFALAWSTLGWATSSLTLLRALPVAEGNERARQLARRALLLSPDLVDGHILLGYIYRVYDWDWTAAQSEMQQALTLDPNNSGALQNVALLDATLGRWDESERRARSALVRDPLNPDVYWILATTLYRAGRFADAETAYRKLIELAPDYSWAHEYLAKTLIAEHKAEAALTALLQEPDDANRADVLSIVLRANGRDADADAAFKVLIGKYADTDAYVVAMNYAYAGDRDLALQWLERAYQQKDSGFIEIVGEPLFKNLANDPRYKAFLRKLKLPE